ncbi:MAG: cytochrome c oxidase subunit I [Acidimicrobiales bacterium]
MAIDTTPLEEQTGPLALPSGAGAGDGYRPLGVFTRPTTTTGWRGWVTTVDHKRVGILYGVTAFVFFLIGGVEALLIRAQLAQPNGTVLSAETYNQVFTMHGVTMIFLVIMPMANAFANYLIPLQIGAADVAFPRLNALSYWIFLFGALFLNSSWLLGGGADGGWFAYAPNTNPIYSPGHGMDFFAIGLQIVGLASLLGALNLVVTVLNLRAPGMTLMKMPVFTWMAFVTQVLLVFAMPVIAVALFLLTFDRLFDANFFRVEAGADPLLWQHLFWIFGHPEVYILILPSFGIVSEIIPVFSRKPIFGYPFMVFSGIAIAFMGWGVWAHHMFASGIGPVSVAAFSIATMTIAIPTGVKILNWLATMYGGRLTFTTAMLFGSGLVCMFTIGGLSGVTHAVSASDWQQTDTYYIVAHFHYVIFGGSLLGLFGGMYLWWPKVFGYQLNERLGKAHFWTMLIGFNLTFFPMHFAGLQGMPRRTHIYEEGFGLEIWNQLSTLGALIIGIAVVVFIWNLWSSRRAFVRSGRVTVNDPWDARSLEWLTPNPTPAHNFDRQPTVAHLDEFWHRKYGEDEEGRPVRIAETEDVVEKGDAVDAHLPAPSYWPIVLAFGLPIIGYGLIYNLLLCFVGGFIVLMAVFGWIMETPDDPAVAAARKHGHGAPGAAEPTGEIEGDDVPSEPGDGSGDGGRGEDEKEPEPVG